MAALNAHPNIEIRVYTSQFETLCQIAHFLQKEEDGIRVLLVKFNVQDLRGLQPIPGHSGGVVPSLDER
ncbi:hypothetical protein OAH93_02430 [Flavobacteriales bacterium]|nr:hypothetical protein [Flavobacteriales bacterium]